MDVISPMSFSLEVGAISATASALVIESNASLPDGSEAVTSIDSISKVKCFRLRESSPRGEVGKEREIKALAVVELFSHPLVMLSRSKQGAYSLLCSRYQRR